MREHVEISELLDIEFNYRSYRCQYGERGSGLIAYYMT